MLRLIVSAQRNMWPADRDGSRQQRNAAQGWRRAMTGTADSRYEGIHIYIRGTSALLTSALDADQISEQHHAPADFPLGNNHQQPLNRRLCGSQSRLDILEKRISKTVIFVNMCAA
jgi:hypothetical protein